MKLGGVVPALVTPFHDDETIDKESLRKEVDFVIRSGASGVCAVAFAGEFYKLSDSERFQVAQVVVHQVATRVPVIVSVGLPSVRSTVELCRKAESLGAQAVMVAAPTAVPLGLQELVHFYGAVLQASKLPVIVQDADFYGNGLPAEFFVDLAGRYPNLHSAKLESVLAGEKCAQIIRLSGGRVRVLYGMGGISMFDGLMHGACGIMPGPAFVDVYVRIFELHDSGRDDEAKSLFYRLQPFLTFGLQRLELIVGLEKQVLRRRGILKSDRLREPTLCLDESYRQQSFELINMALELTDIVGA